MAEHGEGQTPEEEERPLPSATIWPLGFAAGAAILLVGLGLTNWTVFGIGAGLAGVFGALWAYDAVREHRPKAPPPAAEEAEEVEEPERFGRNVFLERTTLGLGALIGAAVTVPVAGFLIAPAFSSDQGDEDIDLGPLENFPEGEWLLVNFRSKQGQGDVSARTAFIRYNGVANNVPSFSIISNRCVHLGCPTQPGGPVQEEQAKTIETESGTITLTPIQPVSFICPCHGGAYDIEGNRTAGPPVRALDRYTYSIINGALVLGPRYSVGKVEGTGANAKLQTFTRLDPGEHVDGWERIFYPISPHRIYEPNPND